MRKQPMKFHLILMLLVILHTASISQSLKSDTSLAAYKNAVSFYNQSLEQELHLFNGREDKGYPYQFVEGTPYFLTNNWSKGTLTYNGQVYENVRMLYDEVVDEVVYLYFDNSSRIRLSKDKVAGFSIMGHNFIHLTPDAESSLVAGFYDQLYKGKNSLLAKRTKKILNSIQVTGSETRALYSDHYYLKKGNSYFSVSNKRTLLKNLSDKRKELQQYIRQNELDFKKDIENSMVKTLAYYDQLTK